MALVTKGHASGFWLTVSLTDTQRDVSTKTYELTSADYATAVTDTATILAALGNMSKSVISGYAISIRYEEDAFAYPALADNAIKARLSFQLTDRIDQETHDIPAPKDEIFVAPAGPNNKVVDITDAAVIAYAQLFQAGGEALISDGETSDFVSKGQRVSASSG